MSGLFGQSTAAPGGGTGTGSSLFGSLGQKPAAGGLFGQQNQQQQNPAGTASAGTSNTPFGASSTAASGGLFGQQNQQAPAGMSLGSSMFGKPSGSGLFGQSTQQGQPQNATPTTGGGFSLFGQSQQQQQQPSSLGQGLNQNTSGNNNVPVQQWSNWGGSVGNASQNQPNLGQQNMLGSQPQVPSHTQSNSQSHSAGAYFDSLFARSQKGGETKTNMEDLPSLELGLGDLRHRLRKLQSKPSEKPLDGKAHYLLAASGVDPSVAAKDLGMLDVQSGRTERVAQRSSPAEVDVETYLSNLQTKTTLDMIADGLERSIRDFDNFLEDNVTMEWEAQRKRIYQHFGIKPREDATSAGREPQAAFGRSRRGKTQSNAPKASRGSFMGKSSLHHSVIGTPSRIGAHDSEFTDVDRPADSNNGGKVRGSPEERVLRERQSKLAERVRGLNAARLLSRPYPIFTNLAEVENTSSEPHAPHVVEAYRAVIEVVGEDPGAETTLHGATAKERQFADMYLNENPNSSKSIEMRTRILQGSNRFLEKQFLREVESLVAKHPHEAKLGGLPDVTSKIRAYVRLRSARKDLVPDNTELQQIQGEFVWAIVFYLLRSGYVSEAAKYVNDNSNNFRGIDRTFSTYLNNYAASEDRRITNRKLLDRCTNEYVQRSRNAPENSIDPFRMACYKVIGRIELSNRNLEGLNTDVNDWIWLQFNLAREGDRTLEMAGESYGLAELQSSVKEVGVKHFPKSSSEDTNGSFGMFFYLQILAGLYEDAIAYLYSFSYVDSVHFALALEYYGLLRPSDPITGSNELRSYTTKNLTQTNFARMIGYYTRDFRAADVVSAVDYLTLICLNEDLGGEAGSRHSSLCHEALRELVLETREFSKLIGDVRPDGRRIKGVIEERGPLIGLDGADFVNTVTLQAASYADENGRTTDSVLLYHLAGEYDTVIAIVSRALSEAVSLEIGEDPVRLRPVKPRAAGDEAAAQQGGSLSLAAIDDPVELARTMMSMYESEAMFYRKIQDQNKMACRVLLEMSTIKGMVENGQWAQSLDKIRGLEILPLDANGNASSIRACASRFSGLSQPVSINVPNLLMWTVVCCVRQREQLTKGQFSGNEGTRKMMVNQLRQIVLDLTAYTSQLRYRFPPHLLEALARASAE